jgi:hypothetical protein
MPHGKNDHGIMTVFIFDGGEIIGAKAMGGIKK